MPDRISTMTQTSAATTRARRRKPGRARGDTHGYRGHRPKNYRRSDERIAEDVNDCLTAADDVDATDIDIKVETVS